MIDNELDNTTQQVAEPEVQQTVEENPAPAAQASAPAPDNSRETNMAFMRQEIESARRDRDALARELKELRSKPAPEQMESPEEDIHINPDDFVEGKHLSAYNKKLKKLEKDMLLAKQQAEQIAAEALIRTKFPDFDTIVTADALQQLQRDYPEVAASIAANANLQNQAAAAYKVIKQFNIGKSYAAEEQAINKNAAKPKPTASLPPQTSDSPLTHANAFANGLTQDLKDKLYKEMCDACNQ